MELSSLRGRSASRIPMPDAIGLELSFAVWSRKKTEEGPWHYDGYFHGAAKMVVHLVDKVPASRQSLCGGKSDGGLRPAVQRRLRARD